MLPESEHCVIYVTTIKTLITKITEYDFIQIQTVSQSDVKILRKIRYRHLMMIKINLFRRKK